MGTPSLRLLLVPALTALVGAAAAGQLPSPRRVRLPPRILAVGEQSDPVPVPPGERTICWPLVTTRAGACTWSAKVGAVHGGQEVRVDGAAVCDQGAFVRVLLADGAAAWLPVDSLCEG